MLACLMVAHQRRERVTTVTYSCSGRCVALPRCAHASMIPSYFPRVTFSRSSGTRILLVGGFFSFSFVLSFISFSFSVRMYVKKYTKGHRDDSGPLWTVREQAGGRLRCCWGSLLRPDGRIAVGEGCDRQAPRGGRADRCQDRSFVRLRLDPGGMTGVRQTWENLSGCIHEVDVFRLRMYFVLYLGGRQAVSRQGRVTRTCGSLPCPSQSGIDVCFLRKGLEESGEHKVFLFFCFVFLLRRGLCHLVLDHELSCARVCERV